MRRSSFSARRIASAVAALGLAAGVAACGSTAGGSEAGGDYPQGRLSIMAPADPGGGWDETARAFQQSVREAGLADSTEVFNVPGAGGTLGLSQLVSKSSGEPNELMVMGLVMLGAIETNQSSVDLETTAPIATLTTEAEAIVVPSDSKYRTLDDLMEDLQRDPGSVAWGGGSPGGTDQLLVGLLAKEIGADPAETKYVAHDGGGEATAAILSGSVDAGVSGASEFAGCGLGRRAAGRRRTTGREPDLAGLRRDHHELEGHRRPARTVGRAARPGRGLRRACPGLAGVEEEPATLRLDGVREERRVA
jgi:putative tricarboxylic transport membrane protein